MSLPYQRHYNDRVIANNEPYNLEALTYLDSHFKERVTTALQACLDTRPDDPISFVAQQLVPKGVSEATGDTPTTQPPCGGKDNDGFDLCYEGGVHCVVTSVRAQSRPAEWVPGLPIVKLTMPTLYEMESALAMLRESSGSAAGVAPGSEAGDSSPAAVVVVVEPPSAPQELVFLKGIPYVHTLTDTLEYHHRRRGTLTTPADKGGNPVRHSLAPPQTSAMTTRGRGGSDARTDAQPRSNTVQEQALAMLKSSLGDDLASFVEGLHTVFGAGHLFHEGSLQEPQKRSSTDGSSGSTTASSINTTTGDSTTTTSLAVLPSIQKSYLDGFDILDRAFRAVTHPALLRTIDRGARNAYGDSDAVLMSWNPTSPPAVLFVSFNPSSGPQTLSRILSTFIPYYESVQLKELAALREANLQRIRQYDLGFCKEYWRNVHKAREAADAGSGVEAAAADKETRRAGVAGGKKAPQPATRRLSAAHKNSSSPAAEISAAAPGGATGAQQQRQQAREVRRQEEDTTYLEVALALSSRAATCVQANFRGYRTRKALRETQSAATDAKTGMAAATDTARAALKRKHAKAVRFDPPQADSLPPILALVAEHLHKVHGEVFGNYDASAPPECRRHTVYVPVRRTRGAANVTGSRDVGAGKTPSRDLIVAQGIFKERARGDANEDDDEEAEGRVEWHKETVYVPPLRSCTRSPHFNPLRRVLEYHRLARCDTLHEALLAQKQLGGLSSLQHRAYNQLKSAALDILHVAHAELFHRGLLTLDVAVFSRFVRRLHGEVLAWFSQPHLVSRAFLATRAGGRGGVGHLGPERLVAALSPASQQLPVPPQALLVHRDTTSSGSTTTAAATTAATANHRMVAMCDKKSITHERMLLCGAGSVAQAFHAKQPRLNSVVTPCVRIAENVYLTTAAQPIAAYQRIAQTIATELLGTQTPQTVGVAVAAASATDEPSTPQPPTEAGKDVRADDAQEPTAVPPPPGVDVTFVNLCPHPVVYVHGQALVLAPIAPAQHVLGRAAHNHVVVLDVEQAVRTKTPLPKSISDGEDSASGNTGRRLVLQNGSDGPQDGASLKGAEAAEKKRSYSQVFDGLEFRRRSQCRSADAAGAGGSGASSVLTSARPLSRDRARENDDDDAEEDGDSDHLGEKARRRQQLGSLAEILGGASIKVEERALARTLRAMLAESNEITVYEAVGDEEEEEGYRAVVGVTYRTAMQARTVRPHAVTLAQLFPGAETDVVTWRDNDRYSAASSVFSSPRVGRVGSRPQSSSTHHTPSRCCSGRNLLNDSTTASCDHQLRVVVMGTNSSGGNGIETVEGAPLAMGAARGIPRGPPDSALAAKHVTSVSTSELRNAVLPSCAAFEAIAAAPVDVEERTGVVDASVPTTTIHYKRVWLPAGLHGEAWMQRMERYLEESLADLKRLKARTETPLGMTAPAVEAGALVLAAQPHCSDQAVFVAAAVLLSNALEAAVASQRPCSGVAKATFSSAVALAKQSKTAAKEVAGPPDVDPAFLKGFCALLAAAFGKAGVDVRACVGRVNAALHSLENAAGDSAFYTLESILADVEAAKREPLRERCKATILRAVQRAEHFCWLLLLQVFLSLSYTKQSFDLTRDTPLMSFTAFVSGVDGVLAWMESMDPWADCPEECPDTTHARYTNGLRRWDCGDYICFGAI